MATITPRKAYLLAFARSFGTQEQVKEHLNTMGGVYLWRYDMPNSFYIVSSLSAKELAQKLRALSPNGRFIITEIVDNSYGWLTSESWHLIQKKERKPTE